MSNAPTTASVRPHADKKVHIYKSEKKNDRWWEDTYAIGMTTGREFFEEEKENALKHMHRAAYSVFKLPRVPDGKDVKILR